MITWNKLERIFFILQPLFSTHFNFYSTLSVTLSIRLLSTYSNLTQSTFSSVPLSTSIQPIVSTYMVGIFHPPVSLLNQPFFSTPFSLYSTLIVSQSSRLMSPFIKPFESTFLQSSFPLFLNPNCQPIK